jgi:sulfoquinovosidase
MRPLPDWTQEGAIIGLEGGSAVVENITRVLLEHKVPLAGIWLQDWVGTRHDWDGTRLIWNWEVRSSAVLQHVGYEGAWQVACVLCRP